MSLLTSNHQNVINEIMKIGVLEARAISIESALSKMPQRSSQGDVTMRSQFATFARSIKRDMDTMRAEVKFARASQSYSVHFEAETCQREQICHVMFEADSEGAADE
ncbi:unnamed protein product [Prorocentrum cordatum]|uniref:Mediator of RNA polymerase II transcription subunit 11 n=1 Tax=Prorocentrum cordatum TaxID=2364126 RepID=A0ABN9U213_9DINO|nr:unnamed protein product [Polarella glacialis]